MWTCRSSTGSLPAGARPNITLDRGTEFLDYPVQLVMINGQRGTCPGIGSRRTNCSVARASTNFASDKRSDNKLQAKQDKATQEPPAKSFDADLSANRSSQPHP